MAETDIFQNENTLLIVRRKDLIEFAAIYADHILSGQTKAPVKQETEKPISQQEAIAFLGKSRQTLISWRKKGVIKGYRLGGRIYYKPSELILALEKLG
jgi:Helix-turn-helix domain